MPYNRIICLHGAPRSGTSWLGQIFDSSPDVRYKFQPLFSYRFKDRIQVRSTPEEIDRFFGELYESQDDFLDQVQQKNKGVYPIFEKKEQDPSILMMKEVRYHYLVPRWLEQPDIKVIAIIRHPCGVLASWRKIPNEYHPEWDFEKEWKFAPGKNQFRPEEYFGFNRWMEFATLALLMQDKYPDKIKLVTYEELLKNPVKTARELFAFADMTFSPQTQKFISDSSSKTVDDPYSVFRKGKGPDDWKGRMEEHIVQEIYRQLKGTPLARFLT